MKKILLLVAFLFLSLNTFSQTIENHYIVVLKENVKPRSIFTSYRGNVKKVFKNAVNGYSVEMSAEEAEKVKENPNVKSVEQDQLVQATEDTSLYNLDRIDQRPLPRDFQYNYLYNGLGVTTYVIDSGIYFGHNEFEGRASLGQDYVGDGLNGSDCYGHGTHLAGTIGGQTYGVAKKVNLVSMRILNCSGNGQISDIIASLDWIIVNRTTPSVVNISINYAGGSSAVDASITNAKDNGIVVVTSAGNANNDACNYGPANSVDAITVSASEQNDYAWIGANYGSCVDMFAPGLSILSAGLGNPDATAVKGGTSMATPHVVGAIALYLGQRPLDSAIVSRNFIINNATQGAIVDSEGAPNLLLYTNTVVDQQVIPICNNIEAKVYLKVGQTYYYPTTAGRNGSSGVYRATVTVGTGVTPLITFEKKQGQGWNTVASGTSINYNQTKSGTYRYGLKTTSGDGGAVLCYSLPQ